METNQKTPCCGTCDSCDSCDPKVEERARRLQFERLVDQAERMRATWEVALRSLASVLRTVNELNGFDIAQETDWMHPEYPNSDKLCRILLLIQSEVIEAMDEVRTGTRGAFLKELADTIIRCLDLAGGIRHDGGEVDFARILVDIIIANASRGYRHGNKRF